MISTLSNKTKFSNNHIKRIFTIETFNFQYINESLKKIFIVLNDEIIKTKKINCLITLRELRLYLNLQINYVFTFNEKEIKYDEELNIIINDIIKENNIIILKEKECIINISIDNIKNSYSIKCLTTKTLFNLRKIFEINNNYKFIKDNNFILLSQENLYKIQDLLTNKNEIHLKEYKEKHNFFLTEKKIIQGDYIITIGKKVYKMKLNNNFFLYEVRDTIDVNNINDYYFLNLKSEIIAKEDEDKYTIKSISRKKKDIFFVNLVKINLPIQQSKFLGLKNNLKIYKYPHIKLNIEQLQKCKSLIVIGETGSGKTTLLNCLINYLMEIKKEDDFRYIIIDENNIKKEEDSHTLNINSYFILPINKDIPPIKIIDTPGFGDTRENFDFEILQKFKSFIEEETSIFLICFVIKSTINRNTEFQKYVISNILGLFGKDLISNFVILFTFSDGGEPLFIKSLTSNENPFSKIINNTPEPYYIIFNNSAIFSDKLNLKIAFWDICYDGFSFLILKLKNSEKRSLNLSKQIVKLRNEILNKANNLNKILDECLDAQNTLNELIKNFNEEYNKLEEYKNYKYIISNENKTIKKTDCGKHNVICLKCQKTCHKFCNEIQNNDISKCKNIINSICQICKCHYEEHYDQPYYFDCSIKKQEKVDYKIYNNFIKIQIEICKINSLIDLKINNLKTYEIEANEYVKSIQNDFDNLNKISLFSNIYKTQEKFIDYKINIEKSAKKSGYIKKILIYEKYKKIFNKLNNIYENINIFKELNEFNQNLNINRNTIEEKISDLLINTMIIDKNEY